jgi:hypothetical protein
MAAIGVQINKINAAGTVLYGYSATNKVALNIDLNTPVSPLPLPEEGSDSNVLVKVEGNTATWTIRWLIKPETTDKFSGSDYDSNVETQSVLQQMIFFLDTFQPKSIDDKFQMKINDGVSPLTKDGFVTKMNFRWNSDNPVNMNAVVSFIVGDVITVFENDSPQPPTGLAVVAGSSSGDLDLSWVAPTDVGGTALVGYNISYRTQVGDWVTVSTSTSTTKTLTTATNGIVAGATYFVKVRAENTEGLSLPTSPPVEGSAKA